jgi:hypothetical protein
MTARFKPPAEKNVGDLLLDSKNPRIPPDKQSLSPDDLIVFVAETYNSIAIAKSIASHQYFPSEPLIAIAARGGKKWIVVEGNRRLAALKLLLGEELRAKLAARSEWDQIDASNVPTRVPVIVANGRKDVAPIIGYRHISGIQPWDAYSKARYIAAQVESGLSFEEAAREVGEASTEVRANYRNHQIAEQARPNVNSETFNALMNSFGVFARAMQSGDLRGFIGAPAPREVATSKKPIPPAKKDALTEFVGYLFGPDAVLEDSRDLTRLGKVLASPEGLKVLRAGHNLEEAHIASGGLRDRLVNRLLSAARSLRAAKDDMPKYRKDQEVKDLIADCRSALEDLEQAQRQR